MPLVAAGVAEGDVNDPNVEPNFIPGLLAPKIPPPGVVTPVEVTAVPNPPKLAVPNGFLLTFAGSGLPPSPPKAPNPLPPPKTEPSAPPEGFAAPKTLPPPPKTEAPGEGAPKVGAPPKILPVPPTAAVTGGPTLKLKSPKAFPVA